MQYAEEAGLQIVKKAYCDNLIETVKQCLFEGKVALVWVDCFDENTRKDTYQKMHLSHVLLVYGFDEEKEEFMIFDQSRFDLLDYKETKISYDGLVQAYQGFIDYFQREQDIMSYYEIPTGLDIIGKHELVAEYKKTTLQFQKDIEAEYTEMEEYFKYIEQLIEEERLKDTLDMRIEEMNNVINARKVQRYLVLRIYGENSNLDAILEKGVQKSEALRLFFAKMKYGAGNKDTFLKKLERIKQEILQFEKDIRMKF